jgi:predicted DNA-binding protein (UPF0251 family)
MDMDADQEPSKMSPRPRKHRHCHCRFRRDRQLVFKPAATPLHNLEQVLIDHDEIEAINLCDGLGMTQEEAGRKMGISRGTIQRLVTSGRKKIIMAIMKEKALHIHAGRSFDTFGGIDET